VTRDLNDKPAKRNGARNGGIIGVPPPQASPLTGAGGRRSPRRDGPLPKRPTSAPYQLRIDPQAPAKDVLDTAIDTLLNGGVIALPTDTVYGIGADATNPRAVQRLFELKGRGADRAIPLLIPDMKMLRHLSPVRDLEALALLKIYWPGPLTVVLPKFAHAFFAVSQGPTLGVRMPNHAVTLAVIRGLCRPMAVTSANISGRPPATDAAGVIEAFEARLDLILDAGPTPGPTPSTVIDLTQRPYRVLREGAIAFETLREQLGEELVSLGPAPKT